MKKLPEVFEKNKAWASSIKKSDPKFFENLSKKQEPNILWIGCADSRVPANQVCGMEPGDIFVHRNIANLVVPTDLNCLSVMQYAVDVLKVEHIVICGHYGCGGVEAAIKDKPLGLIDNWIRNIKDTYLTHKKEIEHLDSAEKKLDKMVEINIRQQVINTSHNTIVNGAWRRNQPLFIHGWVYDLKGGILRDLNLSVGSLDEIPNPI